MPDGSDHEARLPIGGDLLGGAGTGLPVENPYTTEPAA